jgi:gliding motility-associated-like protein
MKTIFTQYFSLIFIALISFCSTEILNCQEICNDGLDNNNNGFVDGFDSECPCFDNTYFNICQPDCQIDFTPEPITISQDWSSNVAVITMSTLITGDINNDGTPEIITLGTTGMTTNNPRVSSGINVFDGLTGNLLSSFSSPFAYWETPGSLLIADVNNDGFSEIILASSVAGNSLNNQRYIYCYSFNGNFQWKSNVQYGENTPGNNKGGGSLGIADFNYDGIPEVYIFNEIFNAQTGVKLVDGGNNGIGRMETTINNLQNGVYSLTVAGDLTTNFGLELAAGKTVYNVIISNLNGTTGNSMFPINNTLNRDGFTSIADINLDGNLDVIVSCSGNSSNSLLYVWNPLINSIISSVNLPTGNNLDLSGVPFIGDMDGDGAPEIGVCRPLNLFTYKFQNNNLVLKWSLTTSDISGATKISMFDFNQDGLQEIVYRDETQLRIFNGSGSTPQLITSFPSFSGTAFEGPIISDVNNDNQSNILITSDDASLGPFRGRIQCFKSNGQPWAPSRKIWNQYAYFNVNINNDLTVPIQQQNHALQFYNTLGSCLGATLRPLNSFMAQETIRDFTGCPIYPAPDLIISQVDNIVYDCTNQIISIDLTINNQGSTTIFTEFNLMIFEGNNAVPGNFVHNQLVNISLAPLAQTTITVNLTDFSLSTIFALLNFNNLNQNFPYNSVNECNYSNNFFNFSLLPPEIIPTFTQVGPICSGATLSALPTNSTNGISGTWSPAINNTSTTTYTFTPSAGQCATNQIMSITIDPSTTTGSVTTSICEGSSYTWPANGLTYSTAQNGLSFVTGCNTATLNLNLLPNVINAVVDTACGEYLFGSNLLDISGIYVDTFLTTNNCDSIVTLDLTIFEDSSVTYINACDSAQWNGVWYYNDTIVTTAGLYTSIPFGGSTVNSSGQEGNIWYFGNNAGITFETNPPSALNNGAISTFEGCATFSDNQGNLLFYTDGMFVYNKLHQQMPNGFGLLGNPSSAQSGVIVPKPGSQTDFYVFTVAAEGGSNGFRYSEVDMTLDGGLGDVIIPSKNTLLFAPSAEKVAAVAHANGVNYWVISHGINNNSYYAYLLDFNGINNPVISDVGQIESNPGWGYLASSIDGTKLASAMCNQGFELLDFNNQTGVVSNPILLNNPGSAYGISFSPNSQILYGCEIAGGQIYQWDLNAGSSSSIISSMQVIGTGQGSSGGYKGGAIQQGRDGKLYIPQFNQPYLSCINNPNQLGNGCNLQHFAIDLQGNNAQLGLPTFFSSIFESPPAGCDSVATAAITITPTITPTFSIVGPYCIGEAIPDLPLTSSSGITGTWSPAIDNTATTLYTFTPNTGQCALTQTLIITIFSNTIPTFAAVGPYCTGEAIADLSLTSTNGINGTWSPAIDNTATTTYTFTPTSTATPTCATTAALTITITPNTSPIFTAVGPYCSGAIIPNLPLTSTNGISGAWSPAIDNTAITTYTFTPTSSATPTCATTADLTITITPNTYPIFTAVGPYCSGSIIPNLSLTSTNGITGTWSPAIINTTTTPYTFTPTSAATPICATTAALTITINPTPTVSFIPDATIGCLPFETSLTNTTPNAQNCVWTISNGIGLTGCGTIPVIFSNDGCYDVTLTTTVSNGCTSSLTMNNLICVENNPIASFSTSTNELSILNTEVLFDNTSTGANTYQWYFGVNDAESSLENPIFTFPNDYENGQYEVVLIATSTIGCTDTAETIIQINEELLFYIPNTFTPDGDVYNQTFKPVFTSGFDPYNYEMLIFNRWGEMLFETHDVTYGWDGKYALKNCQEGIYSYKITFKNPILDERKVVCGSINLLK